MSQLQRTRRSSESPKTPRAQTSPTFEQLLRVYAMPISENLKETARQHPRAVPVVSEKHLTPRISRSEATDNNPTSPNKTITETVSEKLAPAYAKVSHATHTIASKIAGLTVTTPEAKQATANNPTLFQETAKNTGDITVSPHGGNTVHKLEDNSCEIKQSSPQKWDKGISVKEYFMNKLEPREDERALSQAITDAISPRANAGDNTGVVDKVKDAVTSLFWHEEPSNSMAKATSSSSPVPSSSNNSTANANNHTTNILPNANANNRTTNNLPTATANIRMPSTNSCFSEVSKPAAANSSHRFINSHEVVEEENHGRILQAN